VENPDAFIKKLEKLTAVQADDQASERRKILPYREELFRLYPALKYRPAAVLALFYPDDERWKTVLIERIVYDGVHSGQIAFPGGKKDQEDTTLEATALREAEEELAIPQSEVKIVRSLQPVKIPVSRFIVHPFIGYMPRRPHFVPQPAEVKSIIEMPLETLVKTPWHRKTRLFKGKEWPVIYLPYNGYEIWGATAMVIAEIRDLFRKLEVFS